MSGVFEVLAVGLDDDTLSHLNTTLGDVGPVKTVSPTKALEAAAHCQNPLVTLIDWSTDKHFCEDLRLAATPERCHIVAVGKDRSSEEISHLLEGPVDEVLAHPFGPDMVRTWKRLLHECTCASVHAPFMALEEALAHPTGGEIHVRRGEVTGHIVVQKGEVLWVSLSDETTQVEDLVRLAGGELEADLIDEAYEECHRSGRHINDLLVDWKIVDKDALLEATKRLLAQHLKRILAMHDAGALFLPRHRRPGPIRFTPNELLPILFGERSETPADAGQTTKVTALLETFCDDEAILGASLLQRHDLHVLSQVGQAPRPQVMRNQLATLSAMGAKAEALAADGEVCHVACTIPERPWLAITLAFDLTTTNLGIARVRSTSIASKLARELGESDLDSIRNAP